MSQILKIRPKPKPEFEVIRFNGEPDDAIEVAQWLQEHGAEATLHFKQNGAVMLTIGGYRQDIPASAGGCIYFDPTGKWFTQGQIESNFEVLSRS